MNAAIPEDCGVLQLPYMAYPEHGRERGINDYDHFWTSITNPGKQWSYGAVKYTDASTWAAQLPQVPTDEQVALLRGAGFCAIHLDTRGYVSEALAPIVQADLAARFGAPVATGFDGAWQLYAVGPATATTPEVEAFLDQPFISVDLVRGDSPGDGSPERLVVDPRAERRLRPHPDHRDVRRSPASPGPSPRPSAAPCP